MLTRLQIATALGRGAARASRVARCGAIENGYSIRARGGAFRSCSLCGSGPVFLALLFLPAVLPVGLTGRTKPEVIRAI